MILAGDIGGTHTRLALFEEGATLAPARSGTFPSREHGNLTAIVRSFLAGSAARPDRACLGVAGTVRGGRAEVTNLPWKLDAGALAAELSIGRVALLNDLIAGGIAPRVLPALPAPGFLEAFRGKGRFRPWLEKVPLRVVLDERTPLLGAARYALQEMAG